MYYDARLAAPRLTQGHFRHRLPLCIVLAATAILITLCRPTSPPKASHFVPYIVPPPLGLPAPRVVAAYSRHPSQIAASAQYPWIVPGVGRSRTALSAEYWVGDKGIKVLKPSKAADIQRVRRRPRPPPAPSIYERLEQQKQFEITDQRAKDIAADLIRQVVMIFFTDPSSVWFKDPARLNKNEIRQKQFYVDVDEILPIPFPPDMHGLEWIPSRIAFACYNRGMPIGVGIVIDRLLDYGPNIHLMATFHVEHDMIRSMLIGKGGRTMKQLMKTMNQQLSIQYQRPVTVQLYVEPTYMWSKLIGGIWRFMPY